FVVARAGVQRAVGDGRASAGTCSQAAIDTEQARGDEVLNLISRTGATAFQQDSQSLRKNLGPGPGTLLTTALAASPSGDGARWAAAAARDEQAWYAVDDQGYRLDKASHYRAETQLVTRTTPSASGARFSRGENAASRAAAAYH